MTILVVGRSGQLALSLVEEARRRRTPLDAIGRPTIDLFRPGTLDSAISTRRPALVVNAAAYTAVDDAEQDPEHAFAVNADGAGALARLCEAAAAPLIHISTDYVFDGGAARPYREDDVTRPLGIYGASKLAGERAVADSVERHIILRTAWLHSPFGRNFVRTMLDLGEKGRPIDVVHDQHGSPTYAPHLAKAILDIAAQVLTGANAWGVYHAAASGVASRWGLACEVFSAAGAHEVLSVEARPVPTSSHPTAARRPANSALDCGKLARVFGIALPDWRLGVAECVARLCGSSLPASAAMERTP